MKPRHRAHCSWCLHETWHRLEKARRLARHEYRCERCGGRTLRCRACDDMARGPLDHVPEGLLQRLRGAWSDEFCAVHDGSIASFETLRARLDDLSDYEAIFRRRKRDLRQLSLVAAAGVGGAVVMWPIALLAAPGVAASLGAAGLLGAAGTGTAIETLTGAALGSASLAALGGSFGVAGGTAVIAAAGAALGAHHGALVSQAYLGQIDGFSITKRQCGSGPAVVVIDGFLTERRSGGSDWDAGLREHFPEQPWYHVDWESRRLRELASAALGGAAKSVMARVGARLAGRPRVRSPLALGAVSLVAGLARNPWHTAVVRASMTGAVLADLLVRTRHPSGFVLIGHSLGARVVESALQVLSTRERRVVRGAFLLGGAVSRGDEARWSGAARAVSGRIVNVWSGSDVVLAHLYRAAMASREKPIGAAPIAHPSPSIVDVDVTPIVRRHTDYKPKLAEVLGAATRAAEA